MRRTLLGGAFCALAFASAAFAAKEPVYAVTNARIVTVSGATLENATIVMRDGVIVDIGANVTVPKDARVIDGKGLTVTPGIFDGFGNVGIPSPRPGAGGGGGGGGAAAATPAANPIAPAAQIWERVRPQDALRARDSGITTVVPVPREGLVLGSASVMNLVGDRPEGMVVKNDIALAAHMATAGGQRYPGSLMGTMAFFRQALLDAGHYRDSKADYEKAPSGKSRPKFDSGLESWGEVLGGGKTFLLQTSRVGDLRRAYALADEFKLKMILAGNLHASEDAGFLKEKKPALLVSVNFDPPRAGGGGFGGFGGGADDDRERKDIADAEVNPAALHREGIAFALVSGFATDFVAGVRKAIEKGLPKDVALRAITLTPAEIYGVADRLGSLDKGKIANAVVWSGEPLTREARVRMVFVDGQLHQPEERPQGPGGPPGGRPGETEGAIR